jgi:hypothetical protein
MEFDIADGDACDDYTHSALRDGGLPFTRARILST